METSVSNSKSIQELLLQNLSNPSEKFTLICSGCKHGKPQDLQSFRSITAFPDVFLINVSKFEVPTRSIPSDEYITMNDQVYQLCGVLDHIGIDQDSGHWITWVKCNEAPHGWLKCDDDALQSVAIEEVLNKNNYIFARSCQ